MIIKVTHPYTCAVCGETTEFQIASSTDKPREFDFAMCPPPMLSPVIATWVQVCPRCGYASDPIDRPTGVTRQWLSSSDYASLEDVTDGDSEAPLPSIARKRYMAAKCHLFDGDKVGTIGNLICAAWACDDEGDAATGYAKRFRLLAIGLMDALLREVSARTRKELERDQPLTVSLLIRHLDALRRVGRFEQAANFCASLKRNLITDRYDQLLPAVLDYEQKLIDEGDAGRHDAREAVEAEMSESEYLLYETSRNMQAKIDRFVASMGADAGDQGDDGED